MERPMESNETMVDALSGVVVAGEKLLIDRVDLVLLEWRHAFGRAAADAVIVSFGGLLMLVAVLAANLGLIDFITRSASRPTALFACAAVDALMGGALLVAGMRRVR